MLSPNKTVLRIGEWSVNPGAGQISRNGETVRLEERAMRLLVCLAEQAGELVSIEELLQQVWPDVTVTPDSVYQAVASLRRQLGDDPRQPVYIATAPRLGYRMVATVSLGTLEEDRAEGDPDGGRSSRSPNPHRRGSFAWAVGAVVCIALALLLGSIRSKPNNRVTASAVSEKSVAVLPFLDLTEGMREEEFADGVTEELIDKLSKVSSLRVPTSTAAYFYKNKQIPLAEIAKALGVVYVVDGSTRQSGASVRVAARLVRADNGYVLWSKTFDRPFANRVAVQDEVAAELTQAVQDSVDRKTSNE